MTKSQLGGHNVLFAPSEREIRPRQGVVANTLNLFPNEAVRCHEGLQGVGRQGTRRL